LAFSSGNPYAAVPHVEYCVTTNWPLTLIDVNFEKLGRIPR